MSTGKWSDKEVSFLQRNYGKISNARIAEELGRTKYAVESKAAALRKVVVADPTAVKKAKTTVVPVTAKKPKTAKVVINKPKQEGPANPAFNGPESASAMPLPTRSPRKKRGLFGRIFG